MFKIKRTSNRTLNNKDVLVEVVENTGERPPLPDRPLRRPPSAKVPPRHRATPNSEDTLSNASKQLEISREVKNAQARLTQRFNLEQEIRSLCQNALREKWRRVGDMREALIGKVLEKAVLASREELQRDGWQLLAEMIESEADKMIKARECASKYESSLAKIQNMLEDRLAKLNALR